MPTPAVSVNLCVWRPHERYFREAVQSIRDQTFRDFELIIVEDPSEFDGRAMIPDLLTDPRVRYVRNDARTGLISQRNQALGLSRAPWVAIQDADDIARPQRLARQIEFLAQNPAISVLGSWLEIINGNGRPMGIRRYPTEPDAIAQCMKRYNAIAQPAVIFSRSVAEQCGSYRGAPYVEDYDLWCRVLLRSGRLANLPETLVGYRVHDHASKHTHLRHVLRETILIKQRYFHSQFDFSARLRLLAESCLLVLPPGMVHRLFCLFTYRKTPTRPRQRNVRA